MKSTTLKKLAVFLLSAVTVLSCSCTPKTPDDGGDDNPVKDNDPYKDVAVYTDLSVRESTGTHGAVASANAYASKAGYDILRAGGNAFDAAVAIAFAIGVTEPYASGVGGGGVMTAYNASTGDYVFYNFREFLPAAATYQNYVNAVGSSIPTTGIYSTGVPTEVAGLCAIVDDFGKLSLAEDIQPAITLAEEGFVIASTFADQIDVGKFRSYGLEESVETFSYEGNGIENLMAGDVLKQPDYANVLKAIAENGAAGFYTGWVAQAIVEASESRNGFITQDDLIYAMNNYPKKGEPVHTDYNGYDIYTSNTPSSGGIILAEALNMIEHYCDTNNVTLAEIGNNTAEYIHLIGTALQLSFADKRHYIADNSINPATGDPFVDVPIAGLSNKEYAAQRFDLNYNPNDTIKKTSSYDWGGADGDQSPWDFQTTTLSLEYGIDVHEDDNGTTSFSVADSEGNIVSFTQTLNHFWGSYIVPEKCGFFLNDQLTSFSVKENATQSVHYIAPYKQPVSHIMPTIILKDGKPYATLGSPGSMRIPSAVLQVILNLVDFGMDIQSAINNNRIHSYCVQTADTNSMSDGATYNTHKLIYVENISGVTEALREKNYYVNFNKSLNNFYGGVQGITFSYDNNGNFVSLTGGADPRRDGKALAY